MAPLQLDDTGVITVCSNCGQKNRVAFDKLGHAARCGQCKREVRADAVPLEVGVGIARTRRHIGRGHRGCRVVSARSGFMRAGAPR